MATMQDPNAPAGQPTDPVESMLTTAVALLQDAVRGEPRRRRGDVFDIAAARDWQYIGIDRVTFEGNFSSASPPVITNPTNAALPSDKIYEIVSLEGYVTNPATTGPWGALAQFQIQISKETTNLFSTVQSFGPLVNIQGSTGQKLWPGGSRLVPPGSTLTCTFTANVGVIAWSKISEQDLWGIVLNCNVYRI